MKKELCNLKLGKMQNIKNAVARLNESYINKKKIL